MMGFLCFASEECCRNGEIDVETVLKGGEKEGKEGI